MADAHHDAHDSAHDDHSAHDAHDDHDHDAPDPDESTIRTPLWLPFLGLGFIATLAVVVFLMISPSTPRAATDGDAGTPANAAAAEAAH